MKVKDITIALLLLALAVAGYFLGFERGARQEQLKSDARFLISAHQTLYRSAENGDLQKIQNILGMVLLGEVRSYQYQFGDEPDTNSFAQRFNDAKLIADAVESRLVSVGTALTNIPHTQDTKTTVTKGKADND